LPYYILLDAKGENRSIVVTLLKFDTPINEVLENGTITADKLEVSVRRYEFMITQYH
jgi:hypothetical protein